MQESDAGNLDMPKRNHKVLPLSEKMEVLDLKANKSMLRRRRSTVRTDILYMKL